MSLGPIPFTAMVEYFKIYPVGDFESFHKIMRSLDIIYLDAVTKQEKKKNGSGPNQKNSGKV